jgi:AraC family transcriptional regulator, ethanolamine operon transcriptional activator
MIRLVVREFDEYDEALPCADGHRVLRGHPQRAWRLATIDVLGVRLMRTRDGAASIYSGAGMAGYFIFAIPLTRHEHVLVDGHRFDRQFSAWLTPDRVFHIDSRQPASWLSVTVPKELLMSSLASHADEADPLLLNRNVVKLAPPSIKGLILLAQRLFRTDALCPCERWGHALQNAVQAEIVDATLRALLPLPSERTVGRPAIERAQILDAALGLIGARGDEPVYTGDLCRVAGVSERTLRNVFYEYFGIAPHRYLMIARLNRVRTAIRDAGPGDTISSICADAGIWDFGRFAHQYRELFGVLPSQHLAVNRQVLRNRSFARRAACA